MANVSTKERGIVPADHMSVNPETWDRGKRRIASDGSRRGHCAAVCLALVATACRPALDPQLEGRFAATCSELAAEAAGRDSPVVAGLDGWYFATRELERLGAPAGGDDALSTVVSVHRQLLTAGTALLVVPVPPKSIVYADRLAEHLDVPIPIPRLDPTLEERYTRLREAGVDVLDLTTRFIRDRFHPDGPLYCRQDSRWSSTGCFVAARAIGEVVAAMPALAEAEPLRFEPRWHTSPIRGDLWRALGVGAPAPEELRLRAIVQSTPDGWIAAPTDPQSPIALIGDSHTLVFHAGGDHHASGAGLADQLAWEFGRPVALEPTSTPADDDRLATVVRPAALARHTRLVIWAFAATRLLTP